MFLKSSIERNINSEISISIVNWCNSKATMEKKENKNKNSIFFFFETKTSKKKHMLIKENKKTVEYALVSAE